MLVSWEFLASFIAIAVTFIAMQAAVVITDTIRQRDYRHFENTSSQGLARQYPLPNVDQSVADKRHRSLSPFLEKAHRAASVAQTEYHNAVVRSAGCLALAFFALSLGTLPSESWPLTSWSNPQSLELVLSWIDAIALLSVLILFFYGRRVRRLWIAARAGTELLRQYQILSVVFPNTFSAERAGDLKAQFAMEVDLVAARVQAGSNHDIVPRIERFWATRKELLEFGTLTEADLTPDALVVYLQRRVRRQLGWFTDSNARLEHVAERRGVLLLSFYCIAVMIALFKLTLLLYDYPLPAYLLPLLLIVTGMSAAMTAYYINQNSRSLIHRYNTQLRNVTAWVRTFNDRWDSANLESRIIDLAVKKDIRAHLLKFEDLMIEELADWVHITSHDALELAP